MRSCVRAFGRRALLVLVLPAAALSQEGSGAPPDLEIAQKLSRDGRYVEAAAAARRLLAQIPDGPVARDARILICSAGAADPKAFALRLESQDSLLDSEKKAVSPPRKIAGKPPFYTEEARQAGYEGQMIAEAIIDTDGCVRATRILQGGREDLEKSLQEALMTWVFQPATFEGRPVRVYYSLRVNFGLDRTSNQ